MKHFDEVAKGMQFHLPSPDQLQPLAQRVAQALCLSHLFPRMESYRTALSEIFGATVSNRRREAESEV